MEKEDLQQYIEIKSILNDLITKNPDLEEIKIIFNSAKKEINEFASYQFPIKLFDEDMYNAIKEYAEVDFEITKKKLYQVGKTTKFDFYETKANTKLAEYNYEHSLDFLESMSSNQYSI